ncbi:MAG: DUF3999 family protein [bacterium]|nr:DUF3999 family protein [bacterium]
MKVIKWILILFVVVGVRVAICIADEELLYYKQAEVPSLIKDEIGVITLDADIYKNTDNSFANLRIFDENNNTIPYVVRTRKVNEKVISTYPVPLTTLTFEELADNRINIILENKNKKLVPSDMIIQTPNKNFEKGVSLYGSNDKEQWHLIVENQPIFDYSKFIDLRNMSISFEKVPFTYYKITIDNVSQPLKSSFSQIFTKYSKEQIQEKYEAFIQYEGALHIDNIIFSGKKENLIYGREETLKYPLRIIETSIDKDKKTSEIYISSNRQPLKKIALKVKSKNFKRKVIIEGTDDTTANPIWSGVVSSEIFNISAGQFHKEKIEINLPLICRYLRYRMKIINQDNTPIEIDSAAGKGPIHEILFFHRGKKSLKVCYGGEGFEVPRYDVSSVLAESSPVGGNRWNIGKQQVNTKDTRGKKPILSSKAILSAVLTIMVGVLVYLIIYGVKKVENKE